MFLSSMVGGLGCTLGSDDGESDSDGASTGGVSASQSSSEGSGSDGATASSTDDSGSGTGTTGTTDESSSDGSASATTTDGSASAGTTESTSTGGMGGYCDAADDWTGPWSTLEEEVLTLVNQRRAEGAKCGSQGSFGATGPLTMHPLLRCAARLHSKDMVDRDFFDHTNPDGESPWDRMEKAGYGGYSNAGENIAAGSATAAGVVDQWMSSDGHCSNIMSPDFEEIGVGYYPGGEYGHVWTQVFATK